MAPPRLGNDIGSRPGRVTSVRPMRLIHECRTPIGLLSSQMALSRRKADRIAATVLVVLCVLVVTTCGVAFWPMVEGAFTSPRDIQITRPAIAVRDARALIEDRVKHPDKYGPYTEPDALPESLRIANLRYAKVHHDHIDLVVARNPDWSVGARIWSVRHRPHRDQATRYRGVYFFRYTHELPESLENIP
jgi:hypothetical protein